MILPKLMTDLLTCFNIKGMGKDGDSEHPETEVGILGNDDTEKDEAKRQENRRLSRLLTVH